MSPAFAVIIRHKRVRRVLEQDLIIMFEFGSFRILEPFLKWRSESLSTEHIGSLFQKTVSVQRPQVCTLKVCTLNFQPLLVAKEYCPRLRHLGPNPQAPPPEYKGQLPEWRKP